MALDPRMRALLDAFDDGSPFDVERARASLDELALVVSAGGPAADAHDEVLAGVRVRRYDPPCSRTSAAPGPPLVWLHGGGWVTGGADVVDPMCRELLARTGAPLVSVDYRLAPEHPFPAALDDAVAVLREVASHGPVAVGGDSVGGGLAAAACLVLREEDLPVTAQLLLCPLLDCTLEQPSVTGLGTGYGLTRAALEAMVGHYLQDADPRDPRCSPLHAADLTGLPPAVVVTAGLDPLRDEGEAYAARLHRAGVATAVRRYDDVVHGFPGMSALTPVADEALDWAFAELLRLQDG